ncbi:hypothetical protein DP117_27425 [Brasilonema sp. UFV-L1]|nr:hypothetical protein [Brasilonema sp. UFV-L1]
MSEKLTKQETAQIFENTQHKHRLLILTSHPEISESCSEDIRNNLTLELPYKLRNFFDTYYPSSGLCPVEYYGDYFKKPIGDIDIPRLCQVLNAIPTVVIYTTITDREVFFNVGFWLINSENATRLSNVWHWEENFKNLKKQGANDKEAFRKIRDFIIAVHKLLTAFLTDLYYVVIDPSYEAQLLKPELKQEFASDEYSSLVNELERFQQQQKHELNKLLKKQEIYNFLNYVSQTFRSLPVTIVTGFSGSGKSTFINRILKSLAQDVKVAVLVPDYRHVRIIDIGSHLLYQYHVTNLSETDFLNTVYQVLERPERIDYLIVETTGLADPLPIALTFIGTEFRDLTRLDSIITVADASNYSLDLFNSQAAYSQIAYGDIILLNKTDLVSQTELETLETKILEVKEGARIIRTKHCQAPLPFIVSANLFEFNKYFHKHHHSDYLENNGFTSVFFQSDKPFAIRKFQDFLDNQLLATTFRVNGIMWFDESPQRHIFHLCGKRFTLDDDEWKGEKKNQLMLIGQNLERETLLKQLENCLC